MPDPSKQTKLTEHGIDLDEGDSDRDGPSRVDASQDQERLSLSAQAVWEGSSKEIPTIQDPTADLPPVPTIRRSYELDCCSTVVRYSEDSDVVARIEDESEPATRKYQLKRACPTCGLFGPTAVPLADLH